MLSNLGTRWTAVQPRVLALCAGLVLGPIISSFMGWQVLAGTARTQSEAAVVATQATICESRARVENANPAALDWNARQDLAKRSGLTVTGGSEDYNVTRACADRLRG
jgi:hypothetical protein